MPKETKTTEAEAKAGPQCYRALRNLVMYDSGQWVTAGEIVDLSNRPDSWIAEYLRRGMIETADGEPVNELVELPPGMRK